MDLTNGQVSNSQAQLSLIELHLFSLLQSLSHFLIFLWQWHMKLKHYNSLYHNMKHSTMHGLQITSQGKRLKQLITKRVVSGHVSHKSSIPVITQANASPFLA
jgi:hypothetical protein